MFRKEGKIWLPNHDVSVASYRQNVLTAVGIRMQQMTASVQLIMALGGMGRFKIALAP